MSLKPEFEIYYFQVVEIWKNLCDAHFTLYNLTCDEYSALLKSEIEKIEELVEAKNRQVEVISIIDTKRSDLLREIAENFPTAQNIKNVADLLQFVSEIESSKSEKLLEKYNLLLLDIIAKIQLQNKKNQFFINKALNNIREMREHLNGTRSYNGYNKSGQITRATVT